MTPDSPRDSNLRRPHPLAAELIERLRGAPDARVLDFGAGSGRNAAALAAAGYDVTAIADDRVAAFDAVGAFDAAIATHALLHGTPVTVRAQVVALARALKPGAPFYATFGSKADARYGAGMRIGEDAFAPESGDEQGVAHAFFDEQGVRAVLGDDFCAESIAQHAVDEVVGTWAHARRPQGSVHWFVRATRQ